MSRIKIFELASAVLMILAASFMTACQPEQNLPAQVTAEPAAWTRPVVDALAMETSKARKARLSDIQYDLNIDLTGGEEQFSGEVRMQFSLSDATSDLSIDFGGGSIQNIDVNGTLLSADYNGYFLTLPAASLRNGANTVSISFRHPFSKDGTGLHRFVDPADGLTYLYTYLWPYYANRLFPSFDQPNLKAKITMSVNAPADWVVVSAGAGEAEPGTNGSVLWRFAQTPKMPLYVFSLHAGPYTIWAEDAGGVPIRLFARASLAEYVQVEEWLDITRRGLEFYYDYFDIPYPFGKYDQLIVPDFNIGAMENIAAVTFGEHYVQRQESDRAERESRAGTILHEMAHMWFGDLVTHEWWNGLWLNESFATQMAAISAAEVTEFTDTWHGFFTGNKRRAYLQDSRVTTHPIEVPVNSTADFFSVFDAITYQKGSSVLKQLAHYVGEENYRLGVSEYLGRFSYGNTELEDFVGQQAERSGINLDEWSREWLYKPGFNTLQVELSCDEGLLQSIDVIQTAPEEHPYLRRHQIEIALYNLDETTGQLSADIFPVEIRGAKSALDVPGEQVCPLMVNPNHQDWTYARIALDEQTLAALEQYLGGIPEPLTRSIFLAALYDRAMSGEMPLADYVTQAMHLASSEQNIRVQQQVSSSVIVSVDLMLRLRPETDQALEELLPVLEKSALDHIASAATSDLKHIWFAAWLGVVSTDEGLERVRALLEGSLEMPGLPLSADVRWMLLAVLSRHGVADIDELVAAESTRDVSDYAAKSALHAKAARPDRINKEKWLAELRHPETLNGLAKQRAVMAGLFPPNQTGLQLELLGQILNSLPALSDTSDPYFMSSYTKDLLRPMCMPESVSLLQSAIDDYADRLASTASRLLREAHQADSECLALRTLQ